MKKIICIKIIPAVIALVAGALLLSPKVESAKVNAAEPAAKIGLVAFYDGSPYASVDGTKQMLDQSLIITAQTHDGALYAPARFIADIYGGSIGWEQQTLTASISCMGKNISYTVDSSVMIVDEKEIDISVPAKLINERVYVPTGSFAAAIGAEYSFKDGLAVISVNKTTPDTEQIISMLKTLPVIGTEAKFVELMNDLQESTKLYLDEGNAIRISGMGSMADTGAVAQAEPESARASMMESAAPAPTSSPSGTADNYSATNVQVEGVDEADIIKTDGEYIYYAGQGRLSIVKAVPAGDMKLISTLKFDEKNGFYPREIYVDGNELIIIGASMREFYVNGVPNYQTMTTAYVYDISDKSAPQRVRETEAEGDYVSSRKIGKSVYIVSNSWIYNIANGVYPKPSYYDTAVSTEYQTIPYDRIYYFPGFTVNNYLFVTGFETDKPKQEAKINTYLGSGQSVYVSLGNLYVASTDYGHRIAPFGIERSTVSTPETTVYKFALDSGNVLYSGKQNVPGTILNQFSMDEYNEHFRIATTSHDENYQQINGLYILNSDMELTGKIDDIAPGESIYSARFMGKRAYMVTFKTVDPLFVMDLEDPGNPKILGALKIPGYSNYLHPYDENHLIGIGKDTVEEKETALYQGMKLSLYDVTDVSDPKEMFVEIIGDRGTDSPVLYNHKALLFDPSRDLLAFPINVSTLNPTQEKDIWQYGEFTFQGAYVYGLDLDNGFTLKGKITHMDNQDMLKAGMYSWNYAKEIERIIYIGDNLYTASQAMIKSTAISDMKNVGSVELE